MQRFFSRALSFFGKQAMSEEEKEEHQSLLEENNKVKTVEGVVTKAFSDHGWIDDSIFFHYENVTGDLPLRIGQRVVAVVEEHETSLGWKAIKVDAFCEDCYGGEPSDTKMNLTLGSASEVGGGEHLKPSTYFSLDVVCKDFEPYEGDLMEVVFSFKTEMQDRKIISVKPLRYSHVKQVFITSMCGRDGVVDNNIFFTLDSLKIPAGYVPQLHDLVNVLVVQSTQPSYCWRAISMTPVHME